MNANNEIAALMTLAVTYSRARNISLSTVSLHAAGAGHYLKSLSNGQIGLTFIRREKILSWFSENWPADLDWPGGIPRPENKGDAA